jgi:uncharacterized protein (TIGR02145 family)
LRYLGLYLKINHFNSGLMKIRFHLILSFVSLLIINFSCSTNPNNNGGTPTTIIPIAPSGLTGVLTSSTQLNLTWTDNSTNELGFKVERRLDGGNYVSIGTVNADLLSFNESGLTPNTNYTYRVYSFNAAGNSITYSNEWSVNTGGSVPSGNTVTICNQVWMTKNLDVSTYRNGDVIPQVTDPNQWQILTTGAWCYYQNTSSNGTVYGKLYNWYAINDPRGLAPIGYHVPSDAEWTTMVSCLGGEATAGGKMKEAGLSNWAVPNFGATNSSGFNGLPGGYRTEFGSFGSLSFNGGWWSSTEVPTTNARYRYLYSSYDNVYRGSYSKAYGFSVRCIKD